LLRFPLATSKSSQPESRYHETHPCPEESPCQEERTPPYYTARRVHLDDEAKREWRRIGRALLLCGLLSRIDRAALAGYCVAWSRWVEAEQKLKVQGLMVKTPNGFEQPSPWLNISNKALEQLRGFAAEFGMTPATRSRVEALPVPKAGDRARDTKKRLLFGEGNGKLAKYLRHDADEDAKERRFFGDN
jgi:P27 family predicted phage terminase small subunit